MAIDINQYMNFSIIYSVVLLLYSIYVLYLNKKQADVSKKIDKTNELLAQILEGVKK